MILPSICYIIESTSVKSGIRLFKDFIFLWKLSLLQIGKVTPTFTLISFTSTLFSKRQGIEVESASYAHGTLVNVV